MESINDSTITPEGDGRAVTNIYRPFFLAGILSVLTAGCTLGAIALFGIANQGTYTASAWTPYVLAHANSQLFGWVGFFIMGFSLQQHAPRLSKLKLFHGLSAWSLGLMAFGIALRFVAEPLAQVNRDPWLFVGCLSAVLQAIAFVLFVINIGATRFKTGEGLTWPTTFVFASLGWWTICAIAEPIYFFYAHQVDPLKSILFVAEYFPPYREAQFLGLVTMMIFGVSFVKLSACFGAPKATSSLGWIGFALWNVGILMRMGGWIHYFESGMEDGRVYFASGWVLSAGAFSLVGASNIFQPLTSKLPSHKFIRVAFAWLLVGGLLLAFEPIHLRAIGAPFSHAYIGGVRHAVTVGFISQMIIGVSLLVISRMNDLDVADMPTLYPTFLLLNAGNTARVLLEILTDYSPRAFLPMGATGFVELIGLAIWAFFIIRIMMRRQIAHNEMQPIPA